MAISRPVELPLAHSQLPKVLGELPKVNDLGISHGIGCTVTVRQYEKGGQVVEVDLLRTHWVIEDLVVVLSISGPVLPHGNLVALVRVEEENPYFITFEAKVPTNDPFEWIPAGILQTATHRDESCCPPAFWFSPELVESS